MRAYRARQRAGRAVLAVEVDLVRLSERFIDEGLPAEWDADDREKIAEALEAVIARL
jgi:hypothetical protein